MMCAETKVFERQAHQSGGTGAMYWDHAPAHTTNIASSFPMLSLQHQSSNVHASPSLPPHVHGEYLVSSPPLPLPHSTHTLKKIGLPPACVRTGISEGGRPLGYHHPRCAASGVAMATCQV